MFCPKCGTQNPETGKFCRTCGTNLGNVSAALKGNSSSKKNKKNSDHKEDDWGMSEFLTGSGFDFYNDEKTDNPLEARRRQDPSEVFGDAVKQILSGIGFVIVAIVLFTTGVAGGKFWWWAMLFPAFGLLSKGISDYLKSKKMEKRLSGGIGQTPNSLDQTYNRADLPPAQTEYIKPQGSIYETGDLTAPPSVTEDTTRHLEINKEGETMTLPKK